MENLDVLGVVGEGAYGVVLKCRNHNTKELLAVKRFKESEANNKTVKKTTLREVQTLKMLKHPNIVELQDSFTWQDKLHLVFEYCEQNLLQVLEDQENCGGIRAETVRDFMWQLVQAVHQCHRMDIIHRDLKPENILVQNRDTLKLCDFGFARLRPTQPFDPITDYVATRWYRAPELLLGKGSYTEKIDMWALGCIMAELINGEPLFPGDSESEMIYLIRQSVGSNDSPRWAVEYGFDTPKCNFFDQYRKRIGIEGARFLSSLLIIDPDQRLSANDALKHPYFSQYARQQDSVAVSQCSSIDKDVESESVSSPIIPFSEKSRTASLTSLIVPFHETKIVQKKTMSPFSEYDNCSSCLSSCDSNSSVEQDKTPITKLECVTFLPPSNKTTAYVTKTARPNYNTLSRNLQASKKNTHIQIPEDRSCWNDKVIGNLTIKRYLQLLNKEPSKIGNTSQSPEFMAFANRTDYNTNRCAFENKNNQHSNTTKKDDVVSKIDKKKQAKEKENANKRDRLYNAYLRNIKGDEFDAHKHLRQGVSAKPTPLWLPNGHLMKDSCKSLRQLEVLKPQGAKLANGQKHVRSESNVAEAKYMKDNKQVSNENLLKNKIDQKKGCKKIVHNNRSSPTKMEKELHVECSKQKLHPRAVGNNQKKSVVHSQKLPPIVSLSTPKVMHNKPV